MNKVLVLMSSYNGEKYIQEQLDSLYSQKGVEVNVLVRDDGSTDNTQNILEENSRNYNIKWYKGEHIGIQSSFFDLMKKGSKLNYLYYAFCDQDDTWDDDKLKVAIACIGNTEKPSLYYSGQRLVNEKLQFIESHILNKKRSLKTRFVLSDFAGCTGVFNKSLINEIVNFEPDYMIMHDTWILRVCIAIGGNVIVDPSARINYRQHKNNELGLKHNFLSTIKQINQYINTYQVEKVTKELIRGYDSKIIPEYKEICTWICNYRSNRNYKIKLLQKNNIDFKNIGLNIVYKIKVITNRL